MRYPRFIRITDVNCIIKRRDRVIFMFTITVMHIHMYMNTTILNLTLTGSTS